MTLVLRHVCYEDETVSAGNADDGVGWLRGDLKTASLTGFSLLALTARSTLVLLSLLVLALVGLLPLLSLGALTGLALRSLSLLALRALLVLTLLSLLVLRLRALGLLTLGALLPLRVLRTALGLGYLLSGDGAEVVAPAGSFVRGYGSYLCRGELVTEGGHAPAAVEDLVDHVLGVLEVVVAG